MAFTERPETGAQTAFGSGSDGPCIVAINSATGTASGLVLISADGTETVLWARNNGKLYRGTRANFATPEAAGTALD